MDAKIFDTLLEPVFLLDSDKKIIYCNEPAAILCDISVRKIMRSKPVFDDLFKFSEPIHALTAITNIQDPSPYQEVKFSTESDKQGKVQLTLQPFDTTDASKSWIVFFRDVTLEETLQKKYRAELEQKEDVILDLQKAQAELEKYSKNLEKMVDERTTEIQKLNRLMTALLNSLEQGFFVFNKEGLCLEFASSACEKTIEQNPSGKLIWDVLKLPEKQVIGFKNWLKTLFAEMLPFDDLSPLGPQSFPSSLNKEIKFEYFPLRSNDGAIDGVVVMASDITDLITAQREAETERAYAKMIIQLIQNKRQVQSFILETEYLFKELRSELTKKTFDHSQIFRCLHTIKGGAATFSIKPVSDTAHMSETLLNEWKFNPTSEAENKLREQCIKLEHSFVQFQKSNEVVLGSREKLQQRWIEIPYIKLANFQSKISPELRSDFSQNFLMEPIGEFFKQYNDVCTVIAERDSKQVHPLSFENADLKVLPEIYGALLSTLIHAYRNAVDHGIETPEQRQAAGKPEGGNIKTSFNMQATSNTLEIRIQDDGGGIDPQKIRQKLSAKGIDTQNETDTQVIQHIFDSEFSTREVVTETSGRGIGMDAILFSAKQLGGKAWVESKLGQGTTLIIQVPYLTEEPNKKLQAA